MDSLLSSKINASRTRFVIKSPVRATVSIYGGVAPVLLYTNYLVN